MKERQFQLQYHDSKKSCVPGELNLQMLIGHFQVHPEWSCHFRPTLGKSCYPSMNQLLLLGSFAPADWTTYVALLDTSSAWTRTCGLCIFRVNDEARLALLAAGYRRDLAQWALKILASPSYPSWPLYSLLRLLVIPIVWLS